jgi:hypothetical protein
VGVTIATMATPAKADAAGRAAAVGGTLALFTNANYTGTANVVRYQTCQLTISRAMRVGSYDNQPLDGCRVALRNGRGHEHVLCIGRSVVPIEFIHVNRVVVARGNSEPCRPYTL